MCVEVRGQTVLGGRAGSGVKSNDALVEDLGSTPSPTWWLTIFFHCSSRGSNALFWPPWTPGMSMVTDIHVGKRVIYTKTNLFKKFTINTLVETHPSHSCGLLKCHYNIFILGYNVSYLSTI